MSTRPPRIVVKQMRMRSSLLLTVILAACHPQPAPTAPAATPAAAAPALAASPSTTAGAGPGMKLTGNFQPDQCAGITGTPASVASFDKACSLRDPQGCLELAALYQCGAGVARDPDKAVHYEVTSCDLGGSAGCGAAAMSYLMGPSPDPAKALAFANKGCSLGDNSSCSYVGMIYWQGIGVTADPARAAKIFDDQCAKKKDMMACANDAVLLYMGAPGVTRDLARAKELAETSCQADMQAGCNLLAGLLLEQGGAEDIQRAARLFDKVCEEGGGAACDNLGQLYRHGANGFVPNLDKAKEKFDRACKLENPPGCTHLGEVTSSP